MNQQTYIFLGPQGCGKGTQIQLLKEALNKKDPNRSILHFEMGKSLRELASRPGYTGQLVAKVIADGSLVPYFISVSLFSRFLIEYVEGDKHLIIDGFPRSYEQVAALDSALQFYNRDKVNVVCINISDEESVLRLLRRGRADDTEGGIRKRLAWSRQETMPNIEWFRSNPRYSVVDIDGEHTIEEIHADILSKIGLT